MKRIEPEALPSSSAARGERRSRPERPHPRLEGLGATLARDFGASAGQKYPNPQLNTGRRAGLVNGEAVGMPVPSGPQPVSLTGDRPWLLNSQSFQRVS